MSLPNAVQFVAMSNAERDQVPGTPQMLGHGLTFIRGTKEPAGSTYVGGNHPNLAQAWNAINTDGDSERFAQLVESVPAANDEHRARCQYVAQMARTRFVPKRGRTPRQSTPTVIVAGPLAGMDVSPKVVTASKPKVIAAGPLAGFAA